VGALALMGIQHHVLFDSECPVCTELAEAVERSSRGYITARSLHDGEVRQLLDDARPGWMWEPMLMKIAGDHVWVASGRIMRWQLAVLLGPRRALAVARVARRLNGSSRTGRSPTHDADNPAPCDCGDDTGWRLDRGLTRAVELAHLSKQFRRVQGSLSSPEPSDVWLDSESGEYVVLFGVPAARPGVESFLAFQISRHARRVTDVRELGLEATKDGWRATNREPPIAA